jgi:thiol-disulfide isomerase/thioredoxin
MGLNYRFLLLFFFLPFIAQAEEVSLHILAPDYENKEVYLWIEDDFFSRHRLLIDESRIEKGECHFVFSVETTSKIRIGIDYQFGSMYVEGNSKYQIAFPKRSEENMRSLAWNTRVMLSLLDLPENDVNTQIMSFNGELDAFFSELLLGDLGQDPVNSLDSLDDQDQGSTLAARKFSQKESLVKFKRFMDSIEVQFDSIDLPYFNNYVRYTAASIKYSLGEKKDSLYFEYIKDKEVLYHHPEYVKFFLDFYQNFFEFYSFYPFSDKLNAAFTSEEADEKLSQLVAEDSLSGGKQLKELILINALYDYGHAHTDHDSTIISVLNSISASTQFPEHKKIASHFIDKLMKGKKGSPFPNIEFISYTGDSLFLSDFSGQLIYLQIFASWSSSSLSEMELINELYKKYSGKVTFISLSIDPAIDSFNSFVKDHRNYKWEIGWIGVHPEKLSLLSIYDLPLFYLIEDDLKIAEWPALMPSTGIEKNFYELELKEREEKTFRFWENQTNKSKREE